MKIIRCISMIIAVVSELIAYAILVIIGKTMFESTVDAIVLSMRLIPCLIGCMISYQIFGSIMQNNR